jgi:hypothetical protein
VPRPLRASTAEGPRSANNRIADGMVARGASESVAVTTDPSAAASTEVAEVDLGPVLLLEGFRSTAGARISERAGRRDSAGTATAGAIELARGAVRLEDVTWSVGRTSGERERSWASFSVGRVIVAGAELPATNADQLGAAFGAANSALAGLGIVVESPSVVRQRDGTLAVTPLVVRVGGNDRANPVLGPLFEGLQPLRDRIYEALRSSECPVDSGYVDSVLTIFDIAVASLTGSGGLRLEIGGVRTLHDTTVFRSPFGEPPSFAARPPQAGAGPRRVAGTPGSVTEPRLVAQPGEAGPSATRCRTTHPSGRPDCSRGSAVLAGAASLGVVLALVGADAYRSRRRRTVAA